MEKYYFFHFLFPFIIVVVGFLNDFFCGLDVENLFFGDDFSLLPLIIVIIIVVLG